MNVNGITQNPAPYSSIRSNPGSAMSGGRSGESIAAPAATGIPDDVQESRAPASSVPLDAGLPRMKGMSAEERLEQVISKDEIVRIISLRSSGKRSSSESGHTIGKDVGLPEQDSSAGHIDFRT